MKTISRRDAILHLGAASTLIIFSDCAVNPATGERELILVSREEEVQLGRQSHPQIVSVYGIYDDNQLQNYITNVGRQIVREAPGDYYDFTFTLLDNPTVNAFAAPGGYIYFTRGIMAYFNDAAQFAGVMAHEITHVVARHYAQQYSRAQVAQLGLGLGSIFIEELRQYGELLNLGTQLLFLKYSRDAEREADRYGVEYMTEAGYDGIHLSYFFDTLDRLQGDGALPVWASTHPDPGDREDRVRDLAAKFQADDPRRNYIVNRNDYLQLIDGIVFGNDPRNGFVQNNTFYHPGMRVQFPVPRGWAVANQETEVRMTPENQAALLIFQPIEGQNPQSVAERFVSANNISIRQSRAITVNGMNGFYVLGTASSQNSEMVVSSYFIEMGNTVFAFHGVAPPNQFNSYDDTFQRTVSGFNRITQQQYLNVNPTRIDIRAANRTASLQDVLLNLGAERNQLQQLALLNGLSLNERVQSGTRLKLLT